MAENKRVANRKISEETVQTLDSGVYFIDEKNVSIKEEIENCVKSTIHYKSEDLKNLWTHERDRFACDRTVNIDAWSTKFEVTNESTLVACRRLIEIEDFKSVACLNFASAKNPGGGFLNGANAQEESLARSTALYKSLLSIPDFYGTNQRIKPNDGLYSDQMIYSPSVPVFRDDTDNKLLLKPYTVDIVTMAACNLGVAKRKKEWESKVDKKMRERIGYILAACLLHNREALVLGAWGCGVFRNNPNVVANHFKFWLLETTFLNKFKKVVFAVMDNTKNQSCFKAFETTFKELLKSNQTTQQDIIATGEKK